VPIPVNRPTSRVPVTGPIVSGNDFSLLTGGLRWQQQGV
jgi:hypothetical protein